jgi:hypothetical protein
MQYPASLPSPSINAYPFMSLIMRQGGDYRPDMRIFSNLTAEQVYNCAAINRVDGNAPPRFCPESASAAIRVLSSETFSLLAQIICLKKDGKVIDDKAEFIGHCATQDGSILEYFGRFTETHAPEQLQAWLIAAERGRLNVHWGALAELYNNAEQSQQVAICDLFSGCFGCNLSGIYKVPAPTIEIPVDLIPVTETRKEGHFTFCFNNAKNRWQRDDLYQSEFWVDCINGSAITNPVLIATAPTLEEAIAIATAYTKRMSDSLGFYGMHISDLRSDDDENPCLFLTAGLGSSAKPWQSFAGRLKWNLDKSFSNALERQAHLDTILKIEKRLGVQWSKVQRLEDDLGM